MQSNLELAVDYREAGLADESEQVLKRLVAASPNPNKVNPLVYYDLGYIAAQSREAERSYPDIITWPRKCPRITCFPSGLKK